MKNQGRYVASTYKCNVETIAVKQNHTTVKEVLDKAKTITIVKKDK